MTELERIARLRRETVVVRALVLFLRLLGVDRLQLGDQLELRLIGRYSRFGLGFRARMGEPLCGFKPQRSAPSSTGEISRNAC